MSISEWRCQKYDGDAKIAYYSRDLTYRCWLSLEVHWKTSGDIFVKKETLPFIFLSLHVLC